MKHGKRLLSVVLALMLLVQAAGICITAADTASAVGVDYTDRFDYGIFDRSNALWTAEFKKSSPSSCQKYYDFGEPTVASGVMQLSKGESAELQWTNIPGIKTGGTYTIKFDLTVTDFGNGQAFVPGKTNYVREFYVGIGGWLDQVALQKDSKLYVGGTSQTNTSAYTLNTVYSFEIVWDNVNGTATSTMKNGDTVILSGTRSGADYKGINDYTKSWVFRCCDGAIKISNFSFSDGTTTYAPEGDQIKFQSNGMQNSGYWSVETALGSNTYVGTAPAVENGKLKMVTGNSVKFNWTKLMPVSDFSASEEYTYEFDFKVTDEGTGVGSSSGQTRALFVAPGGWYNQIEFYNNGSKVRAGDSYVNYDSASMLGQSFHAKLVWKDNRITTTITKSDGTVLVSGYRTSSSYSAVSTDQYMTSLVLRCEDGAVEIDNFKFYESTMTNVSTTPVSIPSGKQAVYECDVAYTGALTALSHGDAELFAISSDGIRLCGSITQGSYGMGIYHVKAVISPINKITLVEVTLPGGGTVRRGTSAALSSASEIAVSSTDIDNVSNETITYTDVNTNSYTLNSTEPVYTGFNANVYNLVTSFTDAASDRAFAWTARTSFVSTNTMAIRYRVQGEDAWTVVDAVKETEIHTVADEDFFKADISGLAGGTVYEYQIGIKNSDADWSKTYTFRTATENLKSFSFIALGDTQGNNWNGSTRGSKGFMYAQSALNEAFEQVSDPAFILHTGDIVETGYTAEHWDLYFKALGERGASVPHFAALGNHDCQGTNNNVYFDYHFNHPNNGGTAAFDPAILQGLTGDRAKNLAQYLDETVYSFNYGDVHFVVLNSGDARTAADDKVFIDAQRAWLEADLKANADAKWTIVTVHAPFYHRTGEAESRGWLADVVESYGVDLVIQGHSHLVSRTYPMKNGEIVTKTSPDLIKKGTGTVYTTIGSTTYNHDVIASPNVEECMTIVSPHDSIPSYTEVKVDGDRLVMTVRQLDGMVLDEFTILNQPEVVVEGFQIGAAEQEGCVDARFVATLKGDYKDLDSIGFEVICNGKKVEADCFYVYESLRAGEELLTPDLYGGNYFFCYTVRNIPAGEYSFEVRCRSKQKGAESSIYSGTKTAGFTVNADGSVSHHKSIDVYLIAGQSNAAGYAKVTDPNGAYLYAPELEQGYPSIHYAGNSRNNSNGVRDRDLPWQKVTLGLGVALGDTTSYVGPEAGMAKALSAYYNPETGREAGLIKYAFGGSSLLNNTTGSTHQDGNWVSPSYAEALGVANYDAAVTGRMYRNFLAQVEKNLSELYEYGGYTRINIKGLYWMQGCADRSNPTEYQRAFSFFCSDIRADLSELAMSLTNNQSDLGASDMPIIVGTISQTQNLTSATTEAVNAAFINMQKGLPALVENCYVVDNSQFVITRWNATAGAAEILGSDQWHWNQADALAIGESVGRLIVEELLTSEETPVPSVEADAK